MNQEKLKELGHQVIEIFDIHKVGPDEAVFILSSLITTISKVRMEDEEGRPRRSSRLEGYN